MRYTGYALFISGILLFGIMHFAIALFLSNSAGIAPPGLITTALTSMAGWISYILSIILMVVGIIFIVVNSEWWQKQKQEIKEKNKGLLKEQKKNLKTRTRCHDTITFVLQSGAVIAPEPGQIVKHSWWKIRNCKRRDNNMEQRIEIIA